MENQSSLFVVKDLKQDSEVLGKLEVAVKKHQQRLVGATKTIQDEQVSNYPIIVAYPSFTTIDIGLPLQEEPDLSFNFNATTLEELAVKKVIDLEKVDDFRKVYNQKKEQLCIFLLERPAPQFVFIPYG